MTGLSKLNTNQLRDLAVQMGANRKKLYGTSKQSLIIKIGQLTDKYNQIKRYKEAISFLDGCEREDQKMLRASYQEELARLENEYARLTA